MNPITRRLAVAATFAAAAVLPIAVSQSAAAQSAAPAPVTHETVRNKTVKVGAHEVFYREAGRADAPAILLLHGFPSSSHMFRDLMPRLAGRMRVVAPDLPGFGLTVSPPRGQFDYTFANLAEVIDQFTRAVRLDRYAIYVFDYGAPTGFRLALKHPERVTAIVSQNGNAYEEGLSKDWSPIQAYWRDPSQQNRDALRGFLKLDVTKWQYTHGASDATLVSPAAWLSDQAFLDRPGNDEIQLDLFGDYKTNVALYPQFHGVFRARKMPILAIWGDKDPFFVPAGAEAYRRDTPNAEVTMLDAGHFALETHAPTIAAETLRFLAAHKIVK